MSDISTPRDEWTEREPDRKMCRSLVGGTRAMRDAGVEYLPTEPGEKSDEYRNRLARTFLWGAYGKTTRAMTGVAYRRPLDVTDVPESFDPWLDDIDRQGNGIEQFGRLVLKDQLDEGLCFVLVNYPPGAGDATAEDEMVDDIRPYLIKISAEQLFYWRFVRIGARMVLAEVRFYEQVEGVDEDGQAKDIKSIRRLMLASGAEGGANVVAWELYQQKGASASEWTPVDGGTMEIDEIPIVPFYGQFEERFVGVPPLLDLAWLNLQHYQKQSDMDNIEHFALVPFLSIVGVTENDGNLSLGVTRTFRASSPDAKIGWVEHSGEAIRVAHESLDRVEMRMSRIAMKMLLSDQPEGEAATATEQLISKSEGDADLSTIASYHVQGFKECFRLMGKWLGTDVAAEVSLEASFDYAAGGPEAMNAFLNLAVQLGMQREAIATEAIRRGWLAEGTDIKELLKTENVTGPDL